MVKETGRIGCRPRGWSARFASGAGGPAPGRVYVDATKVSVPFANEPGGRDLFLILVIRDQKQAVFGKFVPALTTGTAIDVLGVAFQRFGEVPPTIAFDYSPAFCNPAMDAFAEQRGFEIIRRAPMDWRVKAIVERIDRRVATKFLETRAFRDLADLNRRFSSWFMAQAEQGR